jgi:hypothetical protein
MANVGAMKTINKQKCVYCQARLATTRDHVPPKSMFSKPKPTTLVTVPACLQCNQGYKKDEDYFLATVTFTEAGISTEGKKLWEQKLQRMYAKDQGIRRLMAKSFAPVELVTPAGLYLGNGLTIEPEWPRIKNVFVKIVKALYYYEYSEPLPNTAKIHFVTLREKEMIEELNKNVSLGKRGWKGTFEYKRNRVPDTPEGSLWLFLIYDTLLFGVGTYKQDFQNTSLA